MFRSLALRILVAGGDELTQFIVVLTATLLATIATGLWAILFFRRRRIIMQSSSALMQLEALNLAVRNHLGPRKPIELHFTHSVRSKAQFDRFDLLQMTRTRLLDHEEWVGREIRIRTDALENYATYLSRVSSVATATLGTSSDARLSADQYQKTEERLFSSLQLHPPRPRARVIASVNYTSPQGRNSYSRQVVLDFEALRFEFTAAQQVRARQSTVAALRQRERSFMTNALRTQILRRDDFRCRMCGATAADGVTLHVDHIEPVSLGGRTDPTNLQTLCAPCNLGKSNRFIG